MMHDDNLKRKAVVLYKMTGNQRLTAERCHVEVSTIHIWRKTDWWKEMEEELRQESRAVLSTDLQKIVNKAVKEVDDRLSHGDWIYDQKLGKMVRKPINAHVANQILKDSITNTNLIEKLKDEDRSRDTKERISDILQKLAEDFKNFASMKLIEGEKIKDAIYVEGQERLQEGVELGAQAPGTDQGTGSEARSTSPRDESRKGTQG